MAAEQCWGSYGGRWGLMRYKRGRKEENINDDTGSQRPLKWDCKGGDKEKHDRNGIIRGGAERLKYAIKLEKKNHILVRAHMATLILGDPGSISSSAHERERKRGIHFLSSIPFSNMALQNKLQLYVCVQGLKCSNTY